MEINFSALGFSVLFALTAFIVIWLLEGFFMKRRESKLSGRPNTDVHVSTSEENIHVDTPSSSATSSIGETVSEPISKEDSSEREPLGSTPIRVESTEQPRLNCPECQSSRIVKRGFADKAHRKQRYRCQQCHVSFLGEAAPREKLYIEADRSIDRQH